MSVIRVQKTKNYTVMSNHHLRNKDLSLKAKGLMSMMLSLPDEWDYSIAGLAAICKEGTDSLRAALKELESCGYLVRTRIRDAKGRLTTAVYDLYEEPQAKNPIESKPTLENPMLEKPTQLNTNINKILNKSNTNYIYTDSIKEVVDFLNGEAGTKYRYTSSKTRQLIKARLKEGFTEDDMKTVIKKKAAAWRGTEWEKFLRPETLFGGKFEGYLNEKEVSKNARDDKHREEDPELAALDAVEEYARRRYGKKQ